MRPHHADSRGIWGQALFAFHRAVYHWADGHLASRARPPWADGHLARREPPSRPEPHQTPLCTDTCPRSLTLLKLYQIIALGTKHQAPGTRYTNESAKGYKRIDWVPIRLLASKMATAAPKSERPQPLAFRRCLKITFTDSRLTCPSEPNGDCPRFLKALSSRAYLNSSTRPGLCVVKVPRTGPLRSVTDPLLASFAPSEATIWPTESASSPTVSAPFTVT